MYDEAPAVEHKALGEPPSAIKHLAVIGLGCLLAYLSSSRGVWLPHLFQSSSGFC